METKFRIRRARHSDVVDMTPMVDVTFLLLVFFMVTAAFQLQKSIAIPRQQSDGLGRSGETPPRLDSVEVEVDDGGSFLVMTPNWQRETPGKQYLVTALREANDRGTSAMRLVIRVHEIARLHALVDAMDAGTIAGYAQLEVTQVEAFD